MYKCDHFKIHELIPPEIFHSLGHRAWGLMDERILVTIDKLQERYGTTTINNYEWGGKRVASGLRTPTSPYYSPTSQHSFGRAVDCLFRDIEVEEVRQDILMHADKYPHIHGIELGTSWLHIDCRNAQGIKTFSK